MGLLLFLYGILLYRNMIVKKKVQLFSGNSCTDLWIVVWTIATNNYSQLRKEIYTSKKPTAIAVGFWRRRRDLNPRCTFAHYSLSRGAPSATWVLLHVDGLYALASKKKLAEREGFEPPVPFGITGFQDQRHQPLGHLSLLEPALIIIAQPLTFVNPILQFRKFLSVAISKISFLKAGIRLCVLSV